VLKGGVLLAAYDARRPTRDVDMQARGISGELEDVLQLVRDIASVQLDDGPDFGVVEASAEVIRDEGEYSGIRVNLGATLATARLSLHVDVNIGDPICPAPRSVELPRLLGGMIALSGYPLPMVYAEKILTALQRGTANTRWRDFADLHLLTGRHRIDGGELQQALSAVAAYRQVELSLLIGVLDGYAALAQPRWLAWRRRQHLDDRLPQSFADVLTAVISFADPALAGTVGSRQWDPAIRTWT
jgi:hypothetical protein